MFRLVKCKTVPDESIGIMLDDETEYDQCPMDEALQQQLKFVHLQKGYEDLKLPVDSEIIDILTRNCFD